MSHNNDFQIVFKRIIIKKKQPKKTKTKTSNKNTMFLIPETIATVTKDDRTSSSIK